MLSKSNHEKRGRLNCIIGKLLFFLTAFWETMLWRSIYLILIQEARILGSTARLGPEAVGKENLELAAEPGCSGLRCGIWGKGFIVSLRE